MKTSDSFSKASALVAVASFITLAKAHSWVEAVNRIADNGTIIPPTGYNRNFVPRSSPGFKGDETDSFRKATGPDFANVPVCMDRQQQQIQSEGFPRLQASPGDMISLRYIENGHTTAPQAGRSPNSGDISIYGTTDGKTKFTIGQVSGWSKDGSSDKGKLITKQPYDDSHCYQVSATEISQDRQKKFPLNGEKPVDGSTDLPCQNNLILPEDAPLNQPYTLFWVWNYTWAEMDPGKIEIYANCVDVDVVAAESKSASANKGVSAGYIDNQPAANAAIPEYFSSLMKDKGPGAAPTSAAAPATTSAQAPASTPQGPATTKAGNAAPDVVPLPSTGAPTPPSQGGGATTTPTAIASGGDQNDGGTYMLIPLTTLYTKSLVAPGAQPTGAASGNGKRDMPAPAWTTIYRNRRAS